MGGVHMCVSVHRRVYLFAPPYIGSAESVRDLHHDGHSDLLGYSCPDTTFFSLDRLHLPTDSVPSQIGLIDRLPGPSVPITGAQGPICSDLELCC
jgi:hypothetical protein